jgi:hypothetical protein
MGDEEEVTVHQFRYSCSMEGCVRWHAAWWHDGGMAVTSATEGGGRSWDGPA